MGVSLRSAPLDEPASPGFARRAAVEQSWTATGRPLRGPGLTCPARDATGRPRCDTAAVSETGVLLLTRKQLACTSNGYGSAKKMKKWQVAVPKAPTAPAWAEQMPFQFLDSKCLEVRPQLLGRQPIEKLPKPIIQAVVPVPPLSLRPGLTLLDEGLADKVAAQRTVQKSKEIEWSRVPQKVVGRKADASGSIREHVPVDDPRNPPARLADRRQSTRSQRSEVDLNREPGQLPAIVLDGE